MSSTDNLLPFDDGIVNDPDAPGLARGVMETLIEYVRRTAEIKDELDRRGADPLIAELADIHDKVKELMVDGGPSLVIDETSDWEAVLSKPRQSDVWSVDNLKKIVTPRQAKRYIGEVILVDAVREGLKNGDLSRLVLETNNVVVKGPPGSRALTIRKRKRGA